MTTVSSPPLKRCKYFGITANQSFICQVEFGSTFRNMASTVHAMCLKRVLFNVAEAPTRWTREQISCGAGGSGGGRAVLRME